MIKINKIDSYKDYGKCVEITNQTISAIVTVEIGPRIVFFGFKNSQNFMNDNRKLLGGRDADKAYTDFFGDNKKWENLGGHRVWLSPESYPETYTPDDTPCTVTAAENGAVFTYAADTKIGVQKELEIKMQPQKNEMQVLMRVKNISSAKKQFSVWGISVCAQNGTLIIPMNTNDTGLLPNRQLTMWPYTDISAANFGFGKKYLTVKQIPHGKPYKAKIGLDLNCGRVYYHLNGEIFCKQYSANHPNGIYPDGGCSFESYVCNEMIELETLSELKTVDIGETLEHSEIWSLNKTDFIADYTNQDDIDSLIKDI